jgi:hypothetical protein
MYQGTFERHRLVKTGTAAFRYDVVQTHKKENSAYRYYVIQTHKKSSCYKKGVLTIGVFAFEEL